MRIDVIGKHLEVTPAIKQYAETKAGKLPRYFDGTQAVRVLVEKGTNGSFLVEIAVDVEHHKDFIAHAKAEDLYACIDTAVDKASRQLRDFKEKLRN